MARRVPDLLSIDQARAAVLDAVRPLGTEEVSVADAAGRVLAEDVVAPHDVPPFDNSAMDGFVVAAGPEGRTLTIAGESRAGTPAERAPGPGEALRVSTGAVVPPGADAVVPVEQTTEQDGALTLTAEVTPGQHIRRAGEDVASGTTVLQAGTMLDAAGVGIAIIAGRAHVTCFRRPGVTIVATGDELVPPGGPLGPGQIHDSNGLTLSALAHRAGADVLARAHVKDRPEQTRDALAYALERSDVLVISGGVSVGPHDHVKRVLDDLGVEQRFWRVALRPGKPTWFGTTGDTLVFGLPGNPVSSMVTFALFVRPAIAALQGADPATPRVEARLTEAVPRNPGRDEAVRVRLTQSGSVRSATPTGPQGSHQLTSMLNADGLAIVTAGSGDAAAGETVEVELL
jgi:molybdopterin molybdotransferase